MRASWDNTWLAMAGIIAQRSDCELAQVGAVVVDKTNRIIATGHNGAPAGDRSSCIGDCPRYAEVKQGLPATSAYASCRTIHAESNALLFCDRREREGGTIYVSRSSCKDCAKLIANSGLHRVVMVVTASDQHRDPAGIVRYFEEHGILVTVIGGT